MSTARRSIRPSRSTSPLARLRMNEPSWIGIAAAKSIGPSASVRFSSTTMAPGIAMPATISGRPSPERSATVEHHAKPDKVVSKWDRSITGVTTSRSPSPSRSPVDSVVIADRWLTIQGEIVPRGGGIERSVPETSATCTRPLPIAGITASAVPSRSRSRASISCGKQIETLSRPMVRTSAGAKPPAPSPASVEIELEP
jgi:hypothetical protein